MARKRPDVVRVAAVAAPARLPLAEGCLLFMAFLALALVVYWPALAGPFVSDDLHYVASNPYVQSLSFESVRQIFDPRGASSIYVANYAPIHLLLHAVQWKLFGAAVAGHHVTNLLLHALCSVLLVAIFRASGIGRTAAVLGGALFLLHPANVEAVAWISQLKTTLCFAFAVGALLAFPSAPGLATPLFFLALLAKPTASFAIPVAAVICWVRLWRARPPVRHLLWIGVWAVGLLILGVAQIEVNRRSATPDAALNPEGLARLRLVGTIAARYLWMSATSIGVSTFHEPARSVAATAVWFLVSVPLLLLLGLRAVWSLWQRREEAVYWVWAATSFAPISQIFPFLYPMADRYLYFILPGLLGATLLVLRDALALGAAGSARSRIPESMRAAAPRAGMAAGLALCAVFAVRSHARAEIWRTPSLLVADAARNYPDGVSANLLRAKRAAQEGDPDAAVAALRSAQALGFQRFEQLDADPAYDPIRSDPRFRAVQRDMAAWWIAHYDRIENPTQMELRVRALAHLARGENAEALRSLEAALARGGPIDERIRGEIEDVRRRTERTAPSGP